MAEASDDPVAREVAWCALRPRSGSNVRSYRLVQETPERWVYRWGLVLALVIRGAYGAVAVSLLLLAVGLIRGGEDVLPFMVIPLACAVGFALGATLFKRRFPRPVFDLRARRFHAHPEDEGLAFEDIHAVQLAPYLVEMPSERERFFSCELNLVHHDASRTRVVSHGDVAALRSEAAGIAAMLGVPLWDGTAKEHEARA